MGTKLVDIRKTKPQKKDKEMEVEQKRERDGHDGEWTLRDLQQRRAKSS